MIFVLHIYGHMTTPGYNANVITDVFNGLIVLIFAF